MGRAEGSEAPWVSFQGQDATGASERTYVLSMPMQPVPVTEVLKARGLEHSGHTWDQILKLGFPAEVRRVELDRKQTCSWPTARART